MEDSAEDKRRVTVYGVSKSLKFTKLKLRFKNVTQKGLKKSNMHSSM